MRSWKAILMSNHGLRAIHEVEQLAQFEYAATFGSQAVRNVLFNIQPGMTEYEVVELMKLNGLPLSCHLMMSAGVRARMGLPSPSSRRIALAWRTSFSRPQAIEALRAAVLECKLPGVTPQPAAAVTWPAPPLQARAG